MTCNILGALGLSTEEKHDLSLGLTVSHINKSVNMISIIIMNTITNFI